MRKIVLWFCLFAIVMLWPFSLVQAGVCKLDDGGCTVNTPCPAVIERNEYKTALFDVQYPQVCGMSDTNAQERINAVLKQSVDNFIAQVTQAAEDGKEYPLAAKFSAKMEYQVHRQDADLLSLTLLSYQYTGGAHGSAHLDGFTFRLSTGQLLKYTDLFSLDAASRQSLNEKIASQIRQRQIPIFEPFAGLGDNPVFYMKDGRQVVLVFQQYEIAPYSSGILEFAIDY